MKSLRSNLFVYAIALLLIVVLGYYLVPNLPTIQEIASPAVVTNPTPDVKGAATTSATLPTKSWYEVYFTNPKIPFDKVTTGGIETYLIEKINASQNSIELAVYEFDLENVAQALINAKSRGVTVRIVYDDEFSDPDPQMAKVKKAGISAIPDKRSAFMHNKFFIFDHQCIWTGSFNVSVNAAYKNNENAVYFCSPEAAKNYQKEFEEMFAGNFGPRSPSDTPFPSFTVNGVAIENYFAPEDKVMDKLVAHVQKAKRSVHFMAFSFTDDSLAEAMIAGMARGVKVVGVFETRGADSEYAECMPLIKKGGDITLDGNPGTFHHKVIIIDSQTVIFGSFNFSDSANSSNDENLLVVHDPSFAQAYEQEFQRMKQQSITPIKGACKTK